MATEILKITQNIASQGAVSNTFLGNILAILSEIKVELVSAAVGKDQVPVPVVQSLFKMVGWIIFGLVTIIVFMLTGKHFQWIGG